MRRRSLFAAAAFTLAAGCQPVNQDPPGIGEDPCAGFGVVRAVPTSAAHLASCSDSGCGNGLNPPTGGPHCSATTSCKVHTEPQLRCHWIHNLEHGHVVLAYNCPEGCPELVTELTQLQSMGRKGSNGVSRVLVTPDPTLPKRMAAIVWGYSYVSDTYDADAVQCLISHQDELAPEPRLACPP